MSVAVTRDPVCSSLITIRRWCEVFSADPENALNSTHRSGRVPVRYIGTLPVVSPSCAMSLSHMSNNGDRMKGNITSEWTFFRLGFYFFPFAPGLAIIKCVFLFYMQKVCNVIIKVRDVIY